jgi:hypothetical protein
MGGQGAVGPMRLRGMVGIVSSIALSACVVATNDGDRKSPIPGPAGSSGTGGTAGSAGSGGGGTAGSAGSAGSAGAAGNDSGADSSADAAVDSASDADGFTNDGSTTDGNSDGATTDGATTDGATCDDSVGSSVDCSGVNPDPTCSVVGTPFQKSYCERAPTLFKPRVAQRIASCIAGLTRIELCTPLVAQCINDGLTSACADTSVSVQCSAIVSACPAIALAQCQLYLAGMTATARARMVSCMSAGCNLATCAHEL